jgi:hypothetical protein
MHLPMSLELNPIGIVHSPFQPSPSPAFLLCRRPPHPEMAKVELGLCIRLLFWYYDARDVGELPGFVWND